MNQESVQVINTALCSFGMSGMMFHAPFICAHPGFSLYAVWERSAAVAANLYPGIQSYKNLEDMLADDNIHLVVVNTPNHTHADFARKALLAGKHVLVEKSFTVTAAEARELLDLSEHTGKQLAVYHNRRFDSDFKTVKKVAESGVLGELHSVDFNFCRFKPELSAKTHKELPIPGAGLLHDLGPHLVDQALHLFGMPEFVFGRLMVTRPLSVVNDHVDIALFYNNLSVRLQLGLMVKEPLPAYVLHGKNGSFHKCRADVQEDDLKKGQKPGQATWGVEPASAKGLLHVEGKEKLLIESLPGNYLQFYEALYQSLVHRAPLPVTGQDGLNVMRIIDAVLASDQCGMKVNPVIL